MKARTWFGVGLALTLLMVGGLLLTGMLLWHHQVWGVTPDAHGAMMGRTAHDYGSPGATSISPVKVQNLFGDAIRSSGNGDLQVTEILEFEANYYAVVADRETGAAVAEWVLDKSTGIVSSEMGPNMMWHRTGGGVEYGVGTAGETPVPGVVGNDLSQDAARRIADAWLEDHVPGTRVDTRAISFPGYTTFHILEGDEIQGLLSVHGESGHVWLHTWHGGFVRSVSQPEER